NDGPDSGNGTQFLSQLATGVTNLAVSCTFTGNGALCPTLFTGINSISGILTTFPNNGEVRITITGRFPVISPTSVPHVATIIPPLGSSETDSGNNASIVSTTITTLPADVASVISGGTDPWEYNTPVTYEITHTNNGSGIADGGRIGFYIYNTVLPQYSTLNINITGVSISCIGSGGAVCPNLTGLTLPTFIRGLHTNDSRSYNDAFYRLLQVGVWPNGGSLKFTITFTPISNTNPSCEIGGALITPNIIANSYSIPPPGISDPNGSNDDDIQLTSSEDVLIDTCPIVDVASVISGGTDPWEYNTPVTYEITHTNNGSGIADGGRIGFYIYNTVLPQYSTLNINITGVSISCIGSGGAVCPNLTGLTLPTFIRGLHTNDSRSYNDAFYRLLQVGVWPNGGSLKFTITFTPISNTNPSCEIGGALITPNIIANSYSIPPPGISDPNGSNDDDIQLTDIHTDSCVDIASSIDVNPLYAYVSTSMQIVMNYRSGLGTASGSLITGYLSSGFIYDSWSCVSSGGALCGSLVYDAITQTFPGTVPYLPNGGQ
ncbi:MAG TPA: hypothetical protein PLW93_05235, partial [Candidatus Absconditabacterales bacterium]|nr:hypothetical protein [Candidatus Absconditabacterales bacterium]